MSLLILAWAETAQAQDPFLPGLRWVRPAGPSDPWIPRSLAFGAGESSVWAAAVSGNKHLELLPVAGSGTQAPIVRLDAYASALGVLATSAGADPGACFSLTQFPSPDSQHRRTLCERHDPAAVVATGNPAPAWSHDLGFLTNGAGRIACDRAGTRVASAVWDSSTHEVQVDLFEAAGGAPVFQRRLPALALEELTLSADGTRLALAAGLDLWVLDGQGSLLHHEALATSTRALALSGDGSRLALGGSGALRLLEQLPGGAYATAHALPANGAELAARAALSADGRTLALGWWNAQNGTSVRLQLVDAPSGALLWEKLQPGLPGGPQNLPEALAASADGERAAFGCWGDGTAEPELLLVDRSQAAVVLAADLPGSVQGLALDARGERVAVAHKDVHANSFGNTGSVRLYDTGERDLAQRSRAQPGGLLELAAQRAGASFVFFLEGPRSAGPQVFPNTLGVLWLRRNALHVSARSADALGRAEWVQPIPADPLLLGTQRHLQAAFRVNGVLVFGATVLDVLVL